MPGAARSFVLATALWAAAAAAAAVDDRTPLTMVPMIMTHDAGSGYLGRGLVDKWTQTQPTGLAGQLKCGARVFDARPLRKDNKTIWHHGDIAVPYPFSRSLRDIIAWLAKNPTELAVLLVSDCSGDDCMAHVEAESRALSVEVVNDCSRLPNVSLGSAKAMGKLGTGGSLLVVTGSGGSNGAACAKTDYDPSLECISLLGAAAPEAGATPFRGCWTSDKGHQAKINEMLAQLDKFIKSGLSASLFWQAQALWQEGADTVVIGTLRNSSLLHDELESQLNLELARQVRAGRWPVLGLIEINNVCDGGPELLDAIQHAYFAKA